MPSCGTVLQRPLSTRYRTEDIPGLDLGELIFLVNLTKVEVV